MTKRIQIAALFSIGVLAGVIAAYYGMENRSAIAAGGVDHSGECIIASGYLDSSTGATYMLDCSTGQLVAVVPSSKKPRIWGTFTTNVTKDLRSFIATTKVDAFGQPLAMPDAPNYIMTTTPFYVRGKVGSFSWPTEAVSIVETKTGILMMYYIRYNFTRYQQDVPEEGDLVGYCAKQINPKTVRKML